MEFSKEIHGLLERIKKLQKAQDSDTKYSKSNSIIKNMCNYLEENEFDPSEIIPVDDFITDDCETWLYTTDEIKRVKEPNIKHWLRQGMDNICEANNISANIDVTKYGSKKVIDTRTFTRPKKRIIRPGLSNLTDFIDSPYQKKHNTSEKRVLDYLCEHSCDGKPENHKSPQHIGDSHQEETPHELNNSSGNESKILIPKLNFNFSEPVSHNLFDKLVSNSTDRLDSFHNMSPPSLVNSLCSSTYTTLGDSGYVPNTESDNVPSEPIIASKNNSFHESPLNSTYNKTCNSSGTLNGTFVKNSASPDLNTTYQKNNSSLLSRTYNNLSVTNTFTRKPKIASPSANSFKNSCPDINKTFKKGSDFKEKTFQKLSDSQPNLTKEMQQTIYNQSMELMRPETYDTYATRSGSMDSLDEKSSSISTSSKDSGTRIMTICDLDKLARLQEQSLQQVMSTPKPKSGGTRFWEADNVSPIPRQEEYLSEDSDMSDTCYTARSAFSKHSSSSQSSCSGSLTQMALPTVPKLDLHLLPSQKKKQEVSQTVTTRNVPTMVVKPMEMKRPSQYIAKPQTQMPQAVTRGRTRSALPRPSGMAGSTGIPRPASRIPAPRLSRPQTVQPGQRFPSKPNWNEGCY